MHVAEPAARLDSTRTASGTYGRLVVADLASLLNGQVVLVGLLVSVTWLALIGAALGLNIVSDSARAATVTPHGITSRPSYAVYEFRWPVPTSFGSLTVSGAEVQGVAIRQSPLNVEDPDAPNVDPDKVQVSLLMNYVNDLDQTAAAPRLENFRLVSTWGNEADRVPDLSSAPAKIEAHGADSARLTYMVPQDGSVLWLEYREQPQDWPVRVALGWADEIAHRAAQATEPPTNAAPQPAATR